MPVRSGGVAVNGQNAIPSIHAPGSYEHVLEAVCFEACYDPSPWLDDCDEVRLAELKAEQAAKELAEQRRGAPVHAQSYQLPSGLPAPFETFPTGGQRCFTVEPSDVITLRMRPVRVR